MQPKKEQRSGAKNDPPLRALSRLFGRLGLTAFGGPAAHIALMQKEVVDRLGWMDHQHFLDLVGATNLIPGPNSTEMAIHIGHERGGWKGLLVAGFCFIMPAVLITALLAWLYAKYGHLPQVRTWVYGIKPAIIPVILAAGYQLGKRALRNIQLGVIAALVFLGGLLGLDEIALMFGAGLITLLICMVRQQQKNLHGFSPITFLGISSLASNTRLFLIFLKIGAILYGSGYVLFALLDKELVAKGLLTRPQLMDAIAVGQFTPGPLFSSVTFIGWQMGGFQGALLATIAIFLPSFLFVALLNPLVPLMRRSILFSALLDGVNAASVAIIGVVCVSFGQATLADWRTSLIALFSAIVIFGWPKVNSAWVITGGAVMGYGLSFLS